MCADGEPGGGGGILALKNGYGGASETLKTGPCHKLLSRSRIHLVPISHALKYTLSQYVTPSNIPCPNIPCENIDFLEKIRYDKISLLATREFVVHMKDTCSMYS